MLKKVSLVILSVAMFAGLESHLGQARPIDTPNVREAIEAEKALLEQSTATVELPCVISRFDNLMRKVGAEESQDWRLMSAIAYCESRFIENLESQRGAVGIMQIRPVVARHFNVPVESIDDTETNIRLAGKLLRQIEKTLKLDPSTAESDRMSIILACYNGGIGHVTDARRLAKSNGENPNSWEVVARYLRLKADPAIYESELVRYGKFSGSSRTEAYVRGVMKRYEFYRKLADKGPDMIAQVK